MPKSFEDLRELNITYEIPIEQTKEFWEKLEEEELYTTKCNSCGEVMFPPQAYCRNCLDEDLEWIELDGEAEIKAFTHIIIRPQTFRDEEPYTIAVAEFKNYEGVQALAWVEGFKRPEVEVGMDVKLEPKLREEGPPYFVFVPPEE